MNAARDLNLRPIHFRRDTRDISARDMGDTRDTRYKC